MSLMRYEPWGLMEQMRREFDRAMGEEQASAAVSDWVPAVDIKEQEDAFVITADIPGVDPENIEIEAHNGMLSVKGERDSEKKEDKEGYKRIERVHGSFYRRFSLPETADLDNIKAKSNHGVLEITVPKMAAPTTKKISVEKA